jgi:outer membrane receptor protein involved in Fe transport
MKIAANVPLRTSGVGNTTLALSIKNLFDEEYFEYSFGRPRAYYLEGSVKF